MSRLGRRARTRYGNTRLGIIAQKRIRAALDEAGGAPLALYGFIGDVLAAELVEGHVEQHREMPSNDLIKGYRRLGGALASSFGGCVDETIARWRSGCPPSADAMLVMAKFANRVWDESGVASSCASVVSSAETNDKTNDKKTLSLVVSNSPNGQCLRPSSRYGAKTDGVSTNDTNDKKS